MKNKLLISFIKKIYIIIVFLLTSFCFLFNSPKLLATTASLYDAKIGDVYYENYQEAWDKISIQGGTIEVLRNWEINSLLKISKSIKVTVNLNGFAINRGLEQDKDSGEVFLLEESSTLILNGGNNNTTHYGTVNNGRWFLKEENKGNYEINGAVITGGNNSNGGGAIHVKKDATVKIDNVNIVGNICTDDCKGGAIRLQGENSSLQLINSVVRYNTSINGGGGAIWVEGKDASVLIENTKIDHNQTRVSYGDGGAIQINNGTVKINNSELLFNESRRNGGAIYISNGNLIIDNKTTIAYNKAFKEGGAIYVDGNADNVEVKGSLIGNSAQEEGGAIYVNSSINGIKGLKISDIEILGNKALQDGGAIYVDDDNNFSLSNKVIMNGNSPDDLHITSINNIYSSNLSKGSNIGLNTSLDLNKVNIKSIESNYYYSNNKDYKINTDNSTKTFSKVEYENPIIYKCDEYEYPIISHNFKFRGYESTNSETNYYYSDGYFAKSARLYNEHLATMTLNVAMAASQNYFDGSYSESKAAENIINMFMSLGYTNITYNYPEPEFFGIDEEIISTIGYAIASKKTIINNKEVTLIAIAIRGAGYGEEWASNVLLGDGILEAKGFKNAASVVLKAINEYIDTQNIDTSSAKFWLTGFSRSAATANITSRNLTDIYGEDNVYAYCYETPRGGSFYEMKNDLTYANIHNIINAVDFVTFVGPQEMGFIRYGVDHYIPKYKVNTSGYKAQKSQMLGQLELYAPYIDFNDYFHEATIEYFHGTTGATDFIDENYFTKYDYAEDYVPVFINKLQEYSFNYNIVQSIYNKKSSDWYGYRNYWSTFKWYLYKENDNLILKSYIEAPEDINEKDYIVLTLEQAVCNLMNFYFGMDIQKQEQIINKLDFEKLKEKLEVKDIYFDIVGEWQAFDINEKNKHFNNIWNNIDLDTELQDILTQKEIDEFKYSFYVVVDVLVDFLSEDYNKTDQDILGTFIYNLSNIFQTHTPEIALAWLRCYDSYFASEQYICEHNYTEWTTIQEVTEEEYGIKTKQCTKCHEVVYEIIPIESSGVASLIGQGSIIIVVCLVTVLTTFGICVYLINKNKKNIN